MEVEDYRSATSEVNWKQYLDFIELKEKEIESNSPDEENPILKVCEEEGGKWCQGGETTADYEKEKSLKVF